ncbi:MAG: hypothetical protein H7Z19_17675, partial [Chitinophagaceae bacterium]|nr:hypothetical protein [Rubrivivax sp.]
MRRATLSCLYQRLHRCALALALALGLTLTAGFFTPAQAAGVVVAVGGALRDDHHAVWARIV